MFNTVATLREMSSTFFMFFLERDCAGITQALSPEWTPAISICSIIAPMITFLPSDTRSISSSIAPSRNLSTRTGFSGEA